MIKRLLSAVMMLMAGYVIFQNRYRLMNMILGYPAARNLAVGTLMSIPLVRKWMIQAVFLPQSTMQQ